MTYCLFSTAIRAVVQRNSSPLCISKNCTARFNTSIMHIVNHTAAVYLLDAAQRVAKSLPNRKAFSVMKQKGSQRDEINCDYTTVPHTHCHKK